MQGRGLEKGDAALVDFDAQRTDTGEVFAGAKRRKTHMDTDSADMQFLPGVTSLSFCPLTLYALKYFPAVRLCCVMLVLLALSLQVHGLDGGRPVGCASLAVVLLIVTAILEHWLWLAASSVCTQWIRLATVHESSCASLTISAKQSTCCHSVNLSSTQCERIHYKVSSRQAYHQQTHVQSPRP